jgi:hypothetical protein
VSATVFYGAMRGEVRMLHASLPPTALSAELVALGSWSAPLDDVFIHFDFARSIARGAPFQWLEGNGYSSGGTSILYPFVLALGWLVGFRDLRLVIWAGVVACVSVFCLLLACRRLFSRLPAPTALIAPPLLLSVGVLNWSLWSGMEVALYLGVWAGAFRAWDQLTSEPPPDRRTLARRALGLGLWGAALVASRPEGATSIAVLGLGAAFSLLARRDGQTPRAALGRAALLLALVALPACIVLTSHATANWWFTGETSAAGAVSKLEIHDPFRTAAQKFEDWKFFVHYQIDRITEFHLGDDGRHGWIIWYLAILPLLSERTRRSALLLWASLIPWVFMVALNGQVRWQNERYAMPAVAWLLLAASLGLAELVRWGTRLTSQVRASRFSAGAAWLGRARWVAGACIAYAAVSGFREHQRARYIDQLWFYARASRNILEQHVRTGLALKHGFDPPPRRIGLGDAGAIPYAADLPALDLIGLGGYRGMPFARAKRIGLGAVLELVERMPDSERPDVLAIYPSWWDLLPVWFGERLFEVPVHGNVICGGSAKVVYRTDWSGLRGQSPTVDLRGARVVADIDVADLISEQESGYSLSVPHVGFVDMKLLPDPESPRLDLWDGGRVIPGDVQERFRARGLVPGRPARLVLRAAPDQPQTLTAQVAGKKLTLALPRADGWTHTAWDIPAELVGEEVAIEVSSSVARVSFHYWLVQ